MTLTSETTLTSVSPAAAPTSRLLIRMSAPPRAAQSWPEAAISAVRAAASSVSKRTLPR